MKLPAKTEAGLQVVSKVMAVTAAFVLVAMMLLTVGDVVGRYFFNRPIKGTWELIGLLLVCAGTWGLGYCQMKKAHISITVLLNRFPHKVQVIVSSLTYFIGLAGFSLICWQMFLLAKRYFLLTRGNITDTLGVPYSPFMLALSVGIGMGALMLLIDIVNSIAEVIRK
jgi:TRAP-type C4-dicarboxylate transport system permease small subunit